MTWKWLMRLIGWHPTARAHRALEAARESERRADQARAAADFRQREAAQVAARVRAHNVANEYDDWLRRVMAG